MISLKQIAKQVSEDIETNTQWFEEEVSFVLDGSHKSGYIFRDLLLDRLDTTKKNFGKRGSNLIAMCGNQSLQDIYDINANQALSVWKYLSEDNQQYFNKLIRDLLIDIEDENKEG